MSVIDWSKSVKEMSYVRCPYCAAAFNPVFWFVGSVQNCTSCDKAFYCEYAENRLWAGFLSYELKSQD
jgi:hypothetical protein